MNPMLCRLSMLFGLAVLALGAATAQGQSPPVVVGEAVSREVAEGHTFVGTVVPARRSLIGSAVDGRVEVFPKNDGDRVKKGDVLAQLRTRTLELELAATKADLKAVEAELAELTNGSRPEEIAQAKARREAAESLMTFTAARQKRFQTLYERKSISEDELQEAISNADIARQRLQEAISAQELVVKGPRDERKAQTRARIESLAATCDRLQDQIDRHTIVAPFDGYVVSEHTEVGAWVMKGAAVAEVVELDQVDIEVMVLETHIPHLFKGQPARIEIGPLPEEKFVGQVAMVVPQADLRSRSFPVKVRLANRDEHDHPVLKAGMFARVILPVGKRQKGVLVPKDALVLGGPSPVVWVIGTAPSPEGKPAQTASPVPVEIGVADGEFIQVKGNIKPGDKVVIRGNERLLRPGQPVEVVVGK